MMEQRLQAMVCCFSMVQRVLARQPDTIKTPHTASSSSSSSSSALAKKQMSGTGGSSSVCDTSVSVGNTNTIDNASDNNDSNSSNSGNGSGNGSNNVNVSSTQSDRQLPTRTVTGGEAAERVWRYLSAVPTLMEVRILHNSYSVFCLRLIGTFDEPSTRGKEQIAEGYLCNL